MSEEEKKPVTIILKLTIPTRESIASAIKQMFPFVEVSVEEEKKLPIEAITPDKNVPGYKTSVAPPGTVVFETLTKEAGGSFPLSSQKAKVYCYYLEDYVYEDGSNCPPRCPSLGSSTCPSHPYKEI